MTNNGIRWPEPAAKGDGRQGHRLALLIGILMAFTTMLGPVGCGGPTGEPEAATEEPATAPGDEDADRPRGLRTNTPEASPGYVFFNPNRSLTTYLVDLEGRVVHTWQSDDGPGGGAYLLDNGHLLRGAREPDVPVFSGGGQAGRLQELAWDSEVVWDFTFATEDHLLHHDVAVLPSGNILGIAWEQKTPEEANQAGRSNHSRRSCLRRTRVLERLATSFASRTGSDETTLRIDDRGESGCVECLLICPDTFVKTCRGA